MPPSPEASFPTLKIKIGYAYKHDIKAHKRLASGKCSTVLEIHTLQAEIIGRLHEFDEAYRVVRLFFEGLPWHNTGVYPRGRSSDK